MLVKSIEQKIKINKVVSIAMIISSVLISIGVMIFSYGVVENSRKSIYVIDNGIPIMVEQQDILLNRPVEYKSQIELYHRLFFTIIPDDSYIKRNIEKALYLIDGSGKKEYANLREQGFYNQIISSNATISIQADSIILNEEDNSWLYYGKQLINRKSSLVIRHLITKGTYETINRSDNNPHGVLLRDWRIVDNSEISTKSKY